MNQDTATVRIRQLARKMAAGSPLSSFDWTAAESSRAADMTARRRERMSLHLRPRSLQTRRVGKRKKERKKRGQISNKKTMHTFATLCSLLIRLASCISQHMAH